LNVGRFPKNPSAEANKRATRGGGGEAGDKIEAQLAALRAKKDNKTAGRRLGVTIKNLENQVVWVDTSLVHSTSASYIKGAEN
jgi:hypothetical protein